MMDESNEGIPGTVVVAGMFREGDPQVDAEFVVNVLQQLHRHWIDPHLANRELAAPIQQALIVHQRDGTADVRIDSEAQFTAVVGREARLGDPRAFFVGQVTSLWPDAVDPDLAWSGFTTAEQGRIVVFDYQRTGRERAKELVDRASDFLALSLHAVDSGRLAPAIENLNTAAELAVMTLIQLDGWNDHRRHDRRREWLTDAVDRRAVPHEFLDVVQLLASERNPARYAEGTSTLTAEAMSRAIATVRQLISYAATRRGV